MLAFEAMLEEAFGVGGLEEKTANEVLAYTWEIHVRGRGSVLIQSIACSCTLAFLRSVFYPAPLTRQQAPRHASTVQHQGQQSRLEPNGKRLV